MDKKQWVNPFTEEVFDNILLYAVQMAYRKHHMNDDTIGWDELSLILLNALCHEMGDEGYQKWVTKYAFKNKPIQRG